MTQRSLLHREAFTHRSFSAKKKLNTEEHLHTEAGTQRNFRKQKLLHTEDTLHRNFYAKKLLHKKSLCTEKFLTPEAFIYIYIQKLLSKETFTHRNFYTQKLLQTEVFLQKNPLHRGTFTQRNLYAQTRLHTVVFTHRSFCTEKSLSIFHHVSCFMIIHHMSSSHLRFHALLVNSLCRLVFISHGVLSVHASSWLPLRRSKLNENPGIVSD